MPRKKTAAETKADEDKSLLDKLLGGGPISHTPWLARTTHTDPKTGIVTVRMIDGVPNVERKREVPPKIQYHTKKAFRIVGNIVVERTTIFGRDPRNGQYPTFKDRPISKTELEALSASGKLGELKAA